MLEIVILSLVVVAAATFFGVRVVRAVRRASEPACGPGCNGCTVATAECRDTRPDLPVLLVLATLASPGWAFAADTVETWDAGALDVDFYLGYDGAGGADRSVHGDVMVGYGIADRLSIYLGTTVTAHESLANGEPGLYLGVFGTVVDSDHFDFDLFLDVGAGGEGMSELGVTPSLELNFDVDPDHGSFGAYVRAGLAAHAPESTRVVFDVVLNPGVYLTVAEEHQLFLEYDMAVSPADNAVEVGGVAMGYNVVVNDALELISQVHVDIPQAGENPVVSFTAGFIATIDGHVRAPARPARSLLASAAE